MRPRRISRTMIALWTGVVCGIIGAGAYATGAGAVEAHAGRTFTLNDTGRLHLTSKHGFTLERAGGSLGERLRQHLHPPAHRLDEPGHRRSQHLSAWRFGNGIRKR